MTAPPDLGAELDAALSGRDGTAVLRTLRGTPATAADPRPVYRLLGRRRLLAPQWPVRYGGRDGSPADAALVVDALVRAGVPDTLFILSVQIVGAFLLRAGTDAQRDRLLPGLAAGERFATVLYSEPEAGSDLAALRTEAVPGPDGGWQLSGRKVYSIRAAAADHALVLARAAPAGTDSATPRYHGLTLFLVPLARAGVEVGTLPSLADEPFADVLLDGVRVGPDDVVGPVGEAWALLTDALAVERTGVEYTARAAHWLDQAIGRLVSRRDSGGATAEAVGRLGAAVDASRLLTDAVLDQLASGSADPTLAAAAKWHASETAARVARWAAEQEGLAGCLGAGDPHAALGGLWEAAYREVPGLTISAGTSEMLLQTVGGSLLAGGERGVEG